MLEVWVIEDAKGEPVAAYIGSREGLPPLREGERLEQYGRRSQTVELAQAVAHVIPCAKLTALGWLRVPDLIDQCADVGIELELEK